MEAGTTAGMVSEDLISQYLYTAGQPEPDMIVRTGGTQNRVSIVACSSAANVAVGVDWAAANIPTNGLLITGCQFNTGTPFQNFNETDSRVNRKCNSFAATLSSETPIVP